MILAETALITAGSWAIGPTVCSQRFGVEHGLVCPGHGRRQRNEHDGQRHQQQDEQLADAASLGFAPGPAVELGRQRVPLGLKLGKLELELESLGALGLRPLADFWGLRV